MLQSICFRFNSLLSFLDPLSVQNRLRLVGGCLHQGVNSSLISLYILPRFGLGDCSLQSFRRKGYRAGTNEKESVKSCPSYIPGEVLASLLKKEIRTTSRKGIEYALIFCFWPRGVGKVITNLYNWKYMIRDRILAVLLIVRVSVPLSKVHTASFPFFNES